MSSFAGNVYDDSDNELDCKFTLYHYNTGNLSDDRDTEDGQYSIDNADGDVDNNSASFANGDIGILHYWVNDVCCILKIVSDGSNSYTPDVQLIESQPPSTKLFIGNGTVNHLITASNSSSDDYQWEFKGNTMYHKSSWYGRTVCDKVGISKIEYDWGDGFGSDDTHKFTKVGDYDVTVRATNKHDQVSEDTVSTRIRYNEPKVELSIEPNTPVVNEEITVAINSIDVDDRITNQKWYLNGKQQDTLTYVFDDLSDKTFEIITIWNDGFDDHEFRDKLTIKMTNQPPVINMKSESSSALFDKWEFKSHAIDPEGDLAYVMVRVYLDKNEVLYKELDDIVWAQIDSRRVPMDANIQFYVNGTYRVTMQAADGSGLVSEIDEKVIYVTGLGATGNESINESTTNSGSVNTKINSDNRVVYVNIGSLVSGDIETMDASGDIEMIDVSGSIEEVEVGGNVVHTIVSANMSTVNVVN